MSGFVTAVPCTRAEADAVAALDEPLPGQAPVPTLVASESAGGWVLHLYTEGRPDAGLLRQLAALAQSAAQPPSIEALPAADWVALSQAGLEPVNVGRFHLHTAEHRGRARPGQWPLRIDAGLAFGTGQHATTAGCLAALQVIARRTRPRRLLDVGTGTGVLLLAAERLFPNALLIGTDIDGRAVRVAHANARLNGVPPGRVRLLVAPGVAHAGLARAGGHDLVIANILAGPLVRLAPSLAPTVARGGTLLLAGLLAGQRQRVIAAYAARGFRLVRRGDDEWPVLRLEARRAAQPRRALRAAAAAGSLMAARRGTAAARRADSV